MVRSSGNRDGNAYIMAPLDLQLSGPYPAVTGGR
jgi:hypothetical protein